jgi:hypothetical protein
MKQNFSNHLIGKNCRSREGGNPALTGMEVNAGMTVMGVFGITHISG